MPVECTIQSQTHQQQHTLNSSMFHNIRRRLSSISGSRQIWMKIVILCDRVRYIYLVSKISIHLKSMLQIGTRFISLYWVCCRRMQLNVHCEFELECNLKYDSWVKCVLFTLFVMVLIWGFIREFLWNWVILLGVWGIYRWHVEFCWSQQLLNYDIFIENWILLQSFTKT